MHEGWARRAFDEVEPNELVVLAIQPTVSAASQAAASAVEAAYARPASEEFPAAATAQVYSAMNEEEKRRAIAEWERRWVEFVKWINSR